MAQYGDIFKLIIENHEERCKILKPEEQSNEEDHFEDVDQRAFIFKHKVRNWLKDAEYEYVKKSKSSGRSSKGGSSKESMRSSRSSKASSSSKVSSKAKAIEENVKLAELLTEGSRIHGEEEDDRDGNWKTAHAREGGKSPIKIQNLQSPWLDVTKGREDWSAGR